MRLKLQSGNKPFNLGYALLARSIYIEVTNWRKKNFHMRITRTHVFALSAAALLIVVFALLNSGMAECLRDQRSILLQGAYQEVPGRANYAAWDMCSRNHGKVSNPLGAVMKSRQ